MDKSILFLAFLIAATLLAILGFATIQFRRIFRRLRTIDEEVKAIPSFVWATGNLQRFVPVDHPLPNWNHWSMPPDLLSIIVGIVLEKKPRTIVEFGSGVSTIVIASLLREHGGQLISFEHDSDYATQQTEVLKSHGLLEFVDLRVVPIGEALYQPFGHKWYDIPDLELLDDIDLVIVDGPPKAFGDEVRFPGGDLMVSRLKSGGSIVFDDAARRGEQRIKNALMEKYPNLIISEPKSIRGCFIFTKP